MEKLRELSHETWHFYKRTLILVATGSKLYYAWCFSLLAIIIAGFLFYMRQHDVGLIATNMNDQVSWGLYIANFTYLVGAAAAAVLHLMGSPVFLIPLPVAPDGLQPFLPPEFARSRYQGITENHRREITENIMNNGDIDKSLEDEAKKFQQALELLEKA
jgi:hypothetical protein